MRLILQLVSSGIPMLTRAFWGLMGIFFLSSLVAFDGSCPDFERIGEAVGTRSITALSFSISSIDTIYISTNESEGVDTCLSLEELPGDFASADPLDFPANGTIILNLINGVPCLTYTPFTGQSGNFIDTMSVVVCDDLLNCDTTALIASVVPASCDDIVVDTFVEIEVGECFEFGTYCLPINPVNLFDFTIFDNGMPYNQGFVACDYDSLLLYATDIITLQAPNGPYILEAWTVDGQTFSLNAFVDLEELVDSMNVWDPAGNWVLNSQGKIEGGTAFDIYSPLEISQIPFPFNEFSINLSTVEIPNGIQIAVDTGYHEIIINEFATGCQDTLIIEVNCEIFSCPDWYTGADTIQALACDTSAELCLSIQPAELAHLMVLDNGQSYVNGFAGCAFDSTISYLVLGISNPDDYTLESWTVSGQIFTITSFEDISVLVDSMNIWDPNGNWINQGPQIIGGDFSNDYGSIDISENGQLVTTANPSLTLLPNGFALQLTPGDHILSLTDTTTGCSQDLSIFVDCPEITGSQTDTLVTVLVDSTDIFCLDISGLGTISSFTNLCPDQSDGNVGFSLLTASACIQYTGALLGQNTFCLEVCDEVLNICDTINLTVEVLSPIDTIVIDLLTGFSDTVCIDTSVFPAPLNDFFTYCDPLIGANIDYVLEDASYCVEVSAISPGSDTLCLVACDLQSQCDTTILVINVSGPQTEVLFESITMGMPPGIICLDTTELAGTPDTAFNSCAGLSGTFIDFNILNTNGFCVSYEGVLPFGVDTACIVLCDEFGFCDTTILIVQSLENPDQSPPIANNDTIIGIGGQGNLIPILNNDTLFSTLIGIGFIDRPLAGNAVINPDFTVTYLPDPGICGLVDSFSYFISDFGGSDTATVFVEVRCDELVIYTGLSPNGDGINDTFVILGIERFAQSRVRVYNRWGNVIYDRRNYQNEDGWDGSWTGKVVPDGTYFYLVEAEDDNGQKIQKSGFLQVHR